jgi:hypothetical protein
MTVNNMYPLPRVDELLRVVSRAKWLSCIDASMGFHQIPMVPEDCYKTAFVTDFGLHEFVYMPFGAKTASQTYMKMMDTLLEPHKAYARAFIDDAPIFSDEWEEHLVHLRKVFTSVREAGITLKLSKCVFGQRQINFLGFRVGSGQLCAIESKVAAIQNIAEPTTLKALRSFLGVANYYKSHIDHFSEVCVPLTDLTRGKNRQAKFVLNEKQRKAFNDIKERLMNTVNLHSPDPKKPFVLHCDASDSAIAACLAQIDDKGEEYPIAFMSKKLSDCQRRWSTIEREAFAVVYALNYFNVMTYRSHVDVYSDHDPLKYIVTGAPGNAKLCRWSLALQAHDITVYHRPGKKNINADFWTRADMLDPG